MNKTVVFVSYRTLPDRIDEALAAIDSLVATVQALEPDCGGITLLQDTNDPTRITLVEHWPGQDIFLGPHTQQPHIQAFIRSAAAFLAGPPEITFWSKPQGDRPMWIAPQIVPAIAYSDVPRAVEWLERVFGFRERAEARLTWPGGAMAWIEVGDSVFSVTTPDETWPSVPTPGRSNCSMKVYVEDVDGHFARAEAAGATIVLAPQDGFWGGRIYRALDHEGNRWEISQRNRDLAAELWQLPPGVTRGKST